MSGLVNPAAAEMNGEAGALERMREENVFTFDLGQIIHAVGFTESFLDSLGVEVKERITRQDNFRIILHEDSERMIAVFDLPPGGHEQSVRRQSDD